MSAASSNEEVKKGSEIEVRGARRVKEMSKEDWYTSFKHLKNDKTLGPLFRQIEHMNETRSLQSQDPELCLENTRGIVDPVELQKYPDSPTARHHMTVLEHYLTGIKGLNEYTKSKVETLDDCRRLEIPLQGFALGLLQESHMMKYYGTPIAARHELLADYCRLRPADWLVQYLKIMVHDIIIWRESLSPYECSRNEIIALEKLAHKCERFKGREDVQQLHGLYSSLGSYYATTDQQYRSHDAFNKVLTIKPNDISAMYGVAFCSFNMGNYVDAEKMLFRYLELAPKCDEKYPHAHYLLANVYLSMDRSDNLKQVEKYYKLGLKGESYRLPFMSPDIPFKDSLHLLISNRRKLEKKGKQLLEVELD